MLNWLIQMLIALIPIQGKLNIVPFLGFLILFCWIVKIGIEKTAMIAVPEFKWLIGLGTVMILACVAGSNVMHGLYGFMTYFQLFFLFFVIIQIFREKKHLFLTGWVLITSLTICAFLLSIDQVRLIEIQGGLSSISGDEIHGKIKTLNTDPNYWALYFSLAVPFTLYYIIIYKNIIKRILLIACLTILTAGILLTHSMGGCVGLISIIILFLMLQRNIVFWKKLVLLGLSIPIILVTYSLVPATLQSRLQSQYSVLLSEDFEKWGTDRGGLWIAALNLIKKNPVLGVGIGGYIDSMSLQIYNSTGLQQERVAHNSFLAIAVASGIIGLAFFIALVGSILKKLYQELSELFFYDKEFSYLGHAIFISLVCFLIQAMFLDADKDKYLWILLAIAVIFINTAPNVFLKSAEFKTD